MSVDHDQKLYGNVTDLTINSNIGGIDNRFVATVAASSLQFNVSQDDVRLPRLPSTWSIRTAGSMASQQTKNFYTHLDNVSLSFEDRMKLTSNFALIGGIRVEEIELSRTHSTSTAILRSDRRLSVLDDLPSRHRSRRLHLGSGTGMTFYSQYATAADPTGCQHLQSGPTMPLLLTTSRTYETGVKVLVSRQAAGILGLGVRYRTQERLRSRKRHRCSTLPERLRRKVSKSPAAVNPFGGLKLWGNVALRSIAICQLRLHRRQRGMLSRIPA